MDPDISPIRLGRSMLKREAAMGAGAAGRSVISNAAMAFALRRLAHEQPGRQWPAIRVGTAPPVGQPTAPRPRQPPLAQVHRLLTYVRPSRVEGERDETTVGATGRSRPPRTTG